MLRTDSRQSILGQKSLLGLLVTLLGMTAGCASLTNPTLNGVPVNRLPDELLASPRREGLQTVPLSLFGQALSEDYTLAAGDVLAIYVAGVFPPTLDDQQLPAPPVNIPGRLDPIAAGLPPSIGYPVTIRKDGTIVLPLIDPLPVEGITAEKVQDLLSARYLEKGILQPGREAVMVSLMQPRKIRVTVFRQEVGGFAAGGLGDIASSNVKQGTAHILDLRPNENDVLNALSLTGGLPGLDAYDSIFIFRGGMNKPELTGQLESMTSDLCLDSWREMDVEIVHLPTRWPPGDPVPFAPEDVILHPGDVVFIEARSRDYFYTGGLLPRGEFQLPRDYDLDVLEAVAQVRGTLVNGAFGGNNLNGLLIQPGIGNPNPSALTVLRRTPNGGQVPIAVDLNRALRDPRERILIQPGDLLILQETAGESVSRYFTNVFNFTFVSSLIQRGSATGTTSVSVP